MNRIWAIRVGALGLHEVYYLENIFKTRKAAMDYKRSEGEKFPNLYNGFNGWKRNWHIVQLKEAV